MNEQYIPLRDLVLLTPSLERLNVSMDIADGSWGDTHPHKVFNDGWPVLGSLTELTLTVDSDTELYAVKLLRKCPALSTLRLHFDKHQEYALPPFSDNELPLQGNMPRIKRLEPNFAPMHDEYAESGDYIETLRAIFRCLDSIEILRHTTFAALVNKVSV